LWAYELLVFVLEDDESLRDLLKLYLEASGRCTVYAIASVGELERYSGDLVCVSVAILDINLGLSEPTGVDAYRWLRSHGFVGRIIFLTGHARSHPAVREAFLIRDAILLEKPMGIGRLQSVIFQAA
jgi:DNA-binding response OmpR family regulator